jgi:hypothetical protein
MWDNQINGVANDMLETVPDADWSVDLEMPDLSVATSSFEPGPSNFNMPAMAPGLNGEYLLRFPPS